MTPWLITFFTVTFVYYIGKSSRPWINRFLNWIPAILLAYLIPALISEISGVSFSEHPIHDFSKNFFIPLAIVSVMSSLSLRQLKLIGWRPILLFLSGSAFIALFPVLALWGLKDTFFFEEILFKGEYWKGVPPVVGSWIGGSTSQLVLKEVVACPEQVFLSVLVMDNLLVNIWTILMFQYIKRSHAFNRRLRITDRFRPGDVESGQTENIIPSWICLLVMIGLTVATSLLVEEFVIQILFLSAVGLSLSNLISGWNVSFALAAGSILIIVVMAILGLKLNFNTVSLDTTFVVFLIVWLVGHFLFMLFVARLLNLHMAWVSIASMANVGGIATAPAVTAAFRKEWMPHAIILAILSMATGTFWGILTIYLIEKLI